MTDYSKQDLIAMARRHESDDYTPDELDEALAELARCEGDLAVAVHEATTARAQRDELQAAVTELKPLSDDDELGEARMWARHGYEIGQRTCTWTDPGTAPKWLTEGHRPEALAARVVRGVTGDEDTADA